MLGPRLDGPTQVVQVVNNLRCEELCRVTSLKTVWGARRQVVFPVPDQRCERRAIQSAHKSEHRLKCKPRLTEHFRAEFEREVHTSPLPLRSYRSSKSSQPMSLA